MRVEVTKSYKWAPDGNHVREVQVGEVLEGRGAEIALELRCGRELPGNAESALPAGSPSETPPAAASAAPGKPRKK
jgi:hypothetical protein